MSLKERLRIVIQQEFPTNKNWHGFTRWWLEAEGYDYRSNQDKVKFVDGASDGGIDAVAMPLEHNIRDEIIVVQSKFYSSSPKRSDLLRFVEAVDAINSPKVSDFEKWLTSCRENLQHFYEKLRQNRKKCRFVVVTPSSFDHQTRRWLEKNDIEVCSSKEVESLFKTYQAGRTPRLAQMRLYPATPPKLIAETKAARVYIFAIKASELAQAFKKHGDILFSGNIRLAIKGGTPKRVKDGIKETLESNSDEFIFSHNGITIVGYGFKKMGKSYGIEFPSIVNGAQTVSWLGNPQLFRTAKKSSAKIIARLVEVKDDSLLDGIESKVAFRSNNQNKVDPSDFMTDLPALVGLQRYLLQHDLFLERRKGEKKPYYCTQKITKERLAQVLVSVASERGAADSKNKQRLFTSGTSKSLFEEYNDSPSKRLEAALWVRVNAVLSSSISRQQPKSRKRRAQLAQMAAIATMALLVSKLGMRSALLKVARNWPHDEDAGVFFERAFKVIFSNLLRISGRDKKNEPAFYKSLSDVEEAVQRAFWKSRGEVRRLFKLHLS